MKIYNWPEKSLLFVLALSFNYGALHASPLDHLNTKDIGLHKIPHAGTSRILVVPTRVGVNRFPAERLAYLRSYFATEGGPGTFRDYWNTTSNGLYDPIPTVIKPVLYPQSCPIPGRTLSNCVIAFDDYALVFRGDVGRAVSTILNTARDTQKLDFTEFDINSDTGQPDGYFDGVIFDTDLYSGVAFPLAALKNEVSIDASTTGSTTINLGILAIIPPSDHEFGHLFGFVDNYGGPTVNGLMAEDSTYLGAFSRQQLGWSPIVQVNGPMALKVAPAINGGNLLRLGNETNYLLIEVRGAEGFEAYDSNPAGVYVSSIDEAQLPIGDQGFLQGQNLYLPNAESPYLNVSMPLGCSLQGVDGENDCALSEAGASRTLLHSDNTGTGYRLVLGPTDTDGSISICIREVNAENAPCAEAPDYMGVPTHSPDHGIDSTTPPAPNDDGNDNDEGGCAATPSGALFILLPWLWGRRPKKR